MTQVPSVVKVQNRFIGAKVTKETTFINLPLTISKLTVSQILQIQELSTKAQEATNAEAANLDLLVFVIKASAPDDLGDLTIDDFKTFPMDELSTLSTEIMAFSGLQGKS